MNTRYNIRSLAITVALACASATPLLAAKESLASLQAQAKVTEERAMQTALARVPGGILKSGELERERGKLIWSFDISKPKSRNIAEVQVDAKTGEVVSEETETPADQAAEVAGEKR